MSDYPLKGLGPVQGGRGPQQKNSYSLHTKTRITNNLQQTLEVHTYKHITNYNIIKKTGVNGVSNQKTLVARTRHHTEFGSTQMVHLHRMNI